MTTFDPDSVPWAFNMDLANGPTSERYCYAASDLLKSIGREPPAEESADMLPPDETLGTADDVPRSFTWGEWGEYVSDCVTYWDDRLSDAGFYVYWNAGDVVVYDLRGLSDDDREAFYRAGESW